MMTRKDYQRAAEITNRYYKASEDSKLNKTQRINAISAFARKSFRSYSFMVLYHMHCENAFRQTEYVEGPHFPQPHRWYAQVEVKDGKVIKVK